MSHKAILTQRLSPLATGTQPGGEMPSGTGDNEVSNSKWAGVGTPDDWAVRFPGEGAFVLSAGDIADHQKGQFTSTTNDYSDRALWQQEVMVTAGEYITVSATVRAVSGTSPDPDDQYVIMNHTPFAALNLVTLRPTIDTAIVGQVAYYTAQAVTSGNVNFLFGVDRGPSSVTLEAPMVDKFNGLRNYTATDAVEAPAPGTVDLESIAYEGVFEGWPKIQTGNNSARLSTARGFRYQIPRSGTIDEIHYQIASNFDGETSKSRVGGVSAHGYPASWDLQLNVYNATSSWQKTGSPLFTENYTFTNDTGGTGPNGGSRCIMAHDNVGVNVTAGQRLFFEIVNREANPENDHPSINATAVNSIYGTFWVGTGATPPEAAGLWHGDGNLCATVSGVSTSPINRMLWGVAVRYSDGYEDGDISFDATYSAFSAAIYGSSHKVRQTWSAPYYRRASAILVGAWHQSTTIPAGPLRVTITGSDISTVTVDIPAAQIPARNSTYRMKEVALASPLTLSPSTTYTVEFSAPGAASGAGYLTCGSRSAGFIGDPTVATSGGGTRMNPPPSAYNLIDRHDWSGTAIKTTDNYSTTTSLGYPGGGGNLSFALRLDGNVSDTLGGLA